MRIAPIALAILPLMFGSEVNGAQISAPEALRERAAAYMDSFAGDWQGTGKILVGSKTGLTFHCILDGKPDQDQATFAMNGRCWMGWIGAPVRAKLQYNPEMDRFYGEFQDGANGDGVDIAGDQTEDGLMLTLSRGAKRGRLVAEPVGDDKMHVILSLFDRVNNRHVPVVAMGFARRSTLFKDYVAPNGLVGRLLSKNDGRAR